MPQYETRMVGGVSAVIPGPAPTPVLGATGNVLQFVRDPLGHLGRLYAKYGDLVVLARGRPTRLVSTTKGVPATLFLRGPALNRELFTRHSTFHKCALSGVLWPEKVTDRTSPLTRLLTGLFHVNGDEHRAHRRLLMPAFHRRRIEAYRDDMVEIAESVLARFAPGQERDLRPAMMELTLRIATKTLFGTDMGERGVEVGVLLQRWLELQRPAAFFPFDLPGAPYRRWLDTSGEIDHRMSELVEARRSSASDAGDILSALISAEDEDGARLTHDEIVGHAGVIFAAGHETSANGLAWTLFLLSQHPKTAAALVEELRDLLNGEPPTVEQMPQLLLLDAVVKESLRLFPPVPMNHRLAAEDCEMGGFEVRQGTELFSSVFHTHRMEGFFDQPNRFDPERWFGPDPGPYVYNPFGAGPRMCIGSSFAMMEMKIVLAMMLQRFRFELAPAARVDRNVNITLSSRHGLPMRLHAMDHRFSESSRDFRGNVRGMIQLEPA